MYRACAALSNSKKSPILCCVLSRPLPVPKEKLYNRQIHEKWKESTRL